MTNGLLLQMDNCSVPFAFHGHICLGCKQASVFGFCPIISYQLIEKVTKTPEMKWLKLQPHK